MYPIFLSLFFLPPAHFVLLIHDFESYRSSHYETNDRTESPFSITTASALVSEMASSEHLLRGLQQDDDDSAPAQQSDGQLNFFVSLGAFSLLVVAFLCWCGRRHRSSIVIPSREERDAQRERQRELQRQGQRHSLGGVLRRPPRRGSPELRTLTHAEILKQAERAHQRRISYLEAFQRYQVQITIQAENVVETDSSFGDNVEDDTGEIEVGGSNLIDDNDVETGVDASNVAVVEKIKAATRIKLPRRKPSQPTTVPNLCAICLDPYRIGDVIVWSNNEHCRDAFHQDCIMDYFLYLDDHEEQDGAISSPCPCCRQPFCAVVAAEDGHKSNRTDATTSSNTDGQEEES